MISAALVADSPSGVASRAARMATRVSFDIPFARSVPPGSRRVASAASISPWSITSRWPAAAAQNPA